MYTKKYDKYMVGLFKPPVPHFKNLRRKNCSEGLPESKLVLETPNGRLDPVIGYSIIRYTKPYDLTANGCVNLVFARKKKLCPIVLQIGFML